MIIALLAPELLLFLAINERVSAGILLKKVLKFHPHLAKPGMLDRYIPGRAKSTNVSTQCPYVVQCLTVIEQTSQPYFGLVHAFYANMGGFAFYGSCSDDTPTVEESPFEVAANPRGAIEVPRFETLVYIMKHFPHIITNIPEETILDRAESSSLSKAVLIVQVGRFCTNCASRLFQGLPLSLLEVSTAAHAFCTLLTYFVWLSKPLNIATPTLLREKDAQEVYALLKCSREEYDEALEVAKKRAEGDSSAPTGPHSSAKIVLAANALQHLLPTPERPPLQPGFKEPGIMLVPGNLSNKSPNEGTASLPASIISPILYGLAHFLAWNDHFPTPLERLLWRTSSFVVTFSGLVGFTMVFPLLLLDKLLNSGFIQALAGVIVFLAIPAVHIVASGSLIAESLRQLFFLDSTAYQLPSWSNYWPRLS